MKPVKTITIDQLKPGMFIVEMDQPWYRTPFLIHKRLIRHTGDIQLLKQCGVRELKIDPSQGLDLEPLPPEEVPLSPDIQEQTDCEETSANGPTSTEALQPNNPAHPTGLLHPSDSAHNTPPSMTEQTIADHVPGRTASPSLPTNAQTSADNRGASLSLNSEKSTAASQPSPAEPPASSSKEAAQLTSATIGNPAQARSPDLQKELPPGQASLQAAEAQKTYTEAISSMERMFEELESGIVPRPATLRLVVSNLLSRVMEDSAGMLSLLFLQKMKRFDRTLASHALDVCTLALIVAQNYGIPEGEMEVLGAGALLHDIGYIRLPRNLYRKSQDLTEQERTLMQQHPALGQAILREAKEDRDAIVRIVAEHHERSDGSGFPHKLQGDSLSGLAQLVGLVDAYDGMVSRRGGRPAMLPHDAIRQLFRLGDTGQYAKELIQAMIGSLGVYPIGSLVQLNTTEQAVVVGMNPTQRLKPIIKVITGAQGRSYLTPILVDLGVQAAGASARTITKVLDPLQERVNVALFLECIQPEAA
ncbi:MAG: HD domain-containing phosphohydrolase [Nitrospiraceae bacterium]